ncbi:MAG: cation:proton antiporter subunit C [Pseudomonadota bacterium]|nr:cation:proton antiporter subunit C [Pseudomonadota bacterium]
MTDALQFVIDRYNYWIVIVLMMLGLYIVISRGNLVKKIVGLNIFQTSVFILYISMGKIAGGTAPIILGGHGDEGHGAEQAGHAAETAQAAQASALHADPSAMPDAPAANDLAAAAASSEPSTAGEAAGALHAAPSANDALAAAPQAHGFDIADPAAGSAPHAADVVHQAAEIIYSNPLPHVLILTAIVVGVATTAVGLALAVRIREAYGTIEEDELEAADDIAEFGHDFSAEPQAGAGA